MISRRSFLTQIGILGVGAAGAWWLRENVLWPQPQPVFSGPSGSSGWLPFDDDQPRLIVVDIDLGGLLVRALVDSGAQTSVIDLGLARRLGLPLSGITPVLAFGVSGAPQVGRTAVAPVQIGDMRIETLRAAVLDIAPIAAASGRDFSVILGQDVLHAVVADIDFPGRRLSFHDPIRYVPPPGGFYAPARTRQRELTVPISLEGAPLEVVLDTGASGALALSPESAAAAGLEDGRPSVIAPSITFGGLSRDRVVRARNLNFAGADIGPVSVHVYTPARGARVPAGLLGVEVLQRFRVVMETAQGRLYLLPDPNPRRNRR